jgi:SAM-dependent methyltransferase
MGVSEKLIELRWRAAGHFTRPLPQSFLQPLTGVRGLEIGGPSGLFAAGGLVPVYPLMGSVDGVQWSAETAWHELDPDDGYRPDGVRRGELHVLDGLDLPTLPDDSYGVVLSSHVLEHLANPLRALAAWRRVTHPGGYLLIVAPHMQGTFDHRRPLTTLTHMVEDFKRGTREDDLTHLEESLELHDRERDGDASDGQTWARQRRRNPATRLLHHHTFTTRSLLELLDYAGLELLAAETRFPHDIYAIGRWPAAAARPDNREFLATRRPSPFRVDRV